jgi:hypothetical protein
MMIRRGAAHNRRETSSIDYKRENSRKSASTMAESPTSTATALNDAVSTLTTEQLTKLSRQGWLIAPDFLPEPLTKALRADIELLRGGGHFSVSKIGHDGMVQDEKTPFRDIRNSETCGLTGEGVQLPDNAAREHVFNTFHQLRKDLQGPVLQEGLATQGLVDLDDKLAELMYAYYPAGGYYRRHRDAEADTPSSWRQYSFLLYLNEDWKPADGGKLRLHRDTGGDELPPGELPNFVDVPPTAGLLVVFRSDLVPHEVLTTHKERSALVGWFLAADLPPSGSQPVPDSQHFVSEATLEALRSLRSAVPRLTQKLEPQPPTDHSGMIWADSSNEWGISMAGMPPPTPAAPSEPTFPDTDARYWQKIATFSPMGAIHTLSLGGQRLRKMENPVEVFVHPNLLHSVVTLDLANTDLSTDVLTAVLQASPAVQQLYLGGNALGNEGLATMLPYLPQPLQVLDLRYNDLEGSSPALSALRSEKLHLEGNPLGDAGPHALQLKDCRELYLGQCQIGPAGAAALGRAFTGSCLQTVFLEGNKIGDRGAISLREALEQGSHSMEKLYVDNNGLSKEHAIALGSALNSATVIGDAAFFQD